MMKAVETKPELVCVVEWVEQHPHNDKIAVTRCFTAKEAIAQMRKLHHYESDDRALDDFRIVHWATVKWIPPTNRHGKPCSVACFEGRHAECTETFATCHCTCRSGHTTMHAYGPFRAKLPIDRPCSACSAGDVEMKYHDHAPPFCGIVYIRGAGSLSHGNGLCVSRADVQSHSTQSE